MFVWLIPGPNLKRVPNNRVIKKKHNDTHYGLEISQSVVPEQLSRLKQAQNASLAEREIKNQPLWEVLWSEVEISQILTNCCVLFLLDTVDYVGLFWTWIMWSHPFSLIGTFWRTKIWVFMRRYHLSLKWEIKEEVEWISEISKTLKIKRNYWFFTRVFYKDIKEVIFNKNYWYDIILKYE